ncbi:hypothetical protein NLG97_g2241 [Lecanicillium saksenae]|uniref:Uncharacterized protein n=1 Tax=Lecanicillium saksenae TaxID=468837 RepID=A0ACC1R1G7_9HYPO|nr:hypothetical protein NLG97_g2241 [Lecanicillium saksenae]
MHIRSVLLFAVPAVLAAPSSRDKRGETPEGKVDPGTASDCTYWEQKTDESVTCESLQAAWSFKLDDFREWNPLVKNDCSGMNIGNSYCVEVNYGLPRSTTTQPQPTTTTAPGNGITTPSPTQPSMVDNCNKFHLVKEGESCAEISAANHISVADLTTWNPKVGAQCTGLWAKTYACVGVIGSVPATTTTTTTTAPGNGIATPSPTQPNMVDNCNKFHYISKGDSCDQITSYQGISQKDFAKWNPQVGQQCTGLWADTYACVGVIGGTTTTTTSTTSTSTRPTSNGIPTPQPTQPGMVSNCVKFHYVSKGNTCDQITSYQGISQKDFARWNPQIGNQCTGMWADAYACVGIAAFSLKTHYHTGCSGDVYNNVAVRMNEGYCMNTDCQVGSLQIDADGLCSDGEVQLSYWEQPGCTGKWFGYGYSNKGTCRGLWTDGYDFKAIHLRCARSQDDCVNKGSCTYDSQPTSHAC